MKKIQYQTRRQSKPYQKVSKGEAMRHGPLAPRVRAMLDEATAQITGNLCRIEAGSAAGGQFASCDGATDAPTTTRDSAASPQVSQEATKLQPEIYEKVKPVAPGRGHEISLSKYEIKQILNKGVYGIIGAGKRPDEEGWTPEKEQQRKNEIIAECVARGYKYTTARGKYGTEEPSIFVFIPEAKKADIIEMGSRFNQESVIWGHGPKQQMVYTTGPNAGKHHPGRGYSTQPDDKADFFTEIKAVDGVYKFTLNFNFGRLTERMLETLARAFYGPGLSIYGLRRRMFRAGTDALDPIQGV